MTLDPVLDYELAQDIADRNHGISDIERGPDLVYDRRVGVTFRRTVRWCFCRHALEPRCRCLDVPAHRVLMSPPTFVSPYRVPLTDFARCNCCKRLHPLTFAEFSAARKLEEMAPWL